MRVTTHCVRCFAKKIYQVAGRVLLGKERILDAHEESFGHRDVMGVEKKLYNWNIREAARVKEGL